MICSSCGRVYFDALMSYGCSDTHRYGGGFALGGASQYNGSDLVARSVDRVRTGPDTKKTRLLTPLRKGTPIIRINYGYRLGPFGYPQGQEGSFQLFNLLHQ